MMRALANFRGFLALLTAIVWAFGTVAGPLHAAEEDFHHAQHHEEDGDPIAAASDDGSPQDERSVHPEHATHCHSGGCHFHAMARASETLAIVAAAMQLASPSDLSPSQSSTGSLFRPPRV